MSTSSAYRDLRCRQTETTHHERVNSLNHAVYWTWGWRRGTSVYVLVFVLEADISRIWCKDDVTYYMFEDFFSENNWQWLTIAVFVAIQWFIRMYIKYCVDVLICYFNFRWSGHFCIFLLSVYFRTYLPIFWNRWLFDWHRAENKLARIFETHACNARITCVKTTLISLYLTGTVQ